MTRLLSIAALVALIPAATAAQTAPPPPPPPTPPAPVLPAVPLLPPLPMAPMAPPPVEWVMPDLGLINGVPFPDDYWADMALDAQIRMRDVEWQIDRARELTHSVPMPDVHVAPMADFGISMHGIEMQGSDASAYNSAMTSLSRRDYDTAVTRFDRVIAQKGPHADASLHWKAFAQFKLGQSQDALATIATLRSTYPQSRYLNDAKVLEADVRATAGQPADPAGMDDDELKLLAIQGLQRTDPAGAVPLLEGVLTGNNSLRVKERALYVLALTDHPRAHEILMSYARGGGNPDLQLRAISYLTSRRDSQTTSADLRTIYESTEDISIRMAVINAYRSSGDKPSLIRVVTSGGAPVAIRERAVSNLASLAAPQEIWELYQNESNAELRTRMLSALNSMKSVDHLVQAARTERDAEVKERAIRYLGNQDTETTGTILTEMYSTDDDIAVRRAIIRALAEQDNAEGLVTVARKDSSPEAIRDVVTRLSSMAGRSPVAAAFLAEIIKR